MSDINKTIVKVGTILMAMSFPLGLAILSVPDEWFMAWREAPQVVTQPQPASVAHLLENAVQQRASELKQLDAEIVQVKSEVVRLTEQREAQLRELEQLQFKIRDMLHSARSAKADVVVPQPVNIDRAGSLAAPTTR